jgi:mono/diheme cytochrome c family protein
VRQRTSFPARWALFAAALLVTLVTTRSFSEEPVDDWKAPPRAAKKANPIPADDKSQDAGKQIYLANCLACHGAAGKGDGPAAIACNPRPHDLSDPKIAAQTDGELFWKITNGKKPMPSYEKQLSDDDRWNVVNYVRVLAPAPSTQSAEGAPK